MVNKMEEGMIRLANALDEQDMIGFTRSFVNDIRIGRESVNRELLPWITEIEKSWTGVLFLGMGGSAAGGDFVSALCDQEGTIPIRCNRGYDLPNWWTPDWLIVATSYSGNTECDNIIKLGYCAIFCCTLRMLYVITGHMVGQVVKTKFAK